RRQIWTATSSNAAKRSNVASLNPASPSNLARSNQTSHSNVRPIEQRLAEKSGALKVASPTRPPTKLKSISTASDRSMLIFGQKFLLRHCQAVRAHAGQPT